MDPPAITRQRRPFLAPVWLSLLAGIVAIVIVILVYQSATTTMVVVVRPVEKDIGTISDPPLSAEGEEQAQRLARMFGEGSLAGRPSAIFVSDARIAQQTAAPLAERLGVHPIVVPASQQAATVDRALHEYEGKTVLIIGTGDTVPALLHELDGGDVPVAQDTGYDALFVVGVPTFGSPNVVRLRY